ncbi:hypothetical protein KIW84_020174 [Lathyrus oleraceus]|uniref:Reverse transcriptase zinc-binding domain-containing protein n=1 Tax=Pisum sativum TaxID=3888 RepID=A0A9D4Y4M8_PEA|nr:hypothetical protein KIW84_020174 [Pisum sativum]
MMDGTALEGGSVKQFYRLMMYHDQIRADQDLKDLWRLQVPRRIKAFVWLLKHDRLLSNHNKKEHIKDFLRPFNPSFHVLLRLKEYGEALDMDNRVVRRTKEVRLIKWVSPSPGMVKLNDDGTCIEGVVAGCGGLVRDEEVVGWEVLPSMWAYVATT